MNFFENKIISIRRIEDFSGYPIAPYDPPEIYPELSTVFNNVNVNPNNSVYAAVRSTLLDLFPQSDSSNISPFRDLIKPGETVVIKPNLVFDKHELGDQAIAGMITHASVIRPVIDYVLIALQKKGKIIICDVPLQTADWERLMKKSGLRELVRFYSELNIRIELIDLRYEKSSVNDYGVVVNRSVINGDPLGYTAVDLGQESSLAPISQYSKLFSITDYQRHTVSKHHNSGKNEYFIPNTILHANVFIDMPKIKTHRKAGVTLSMKNLIGINGDKSWIAHHREGFVKNGGDEFNTIGRYDLFRYRIYVYLKNNTIGKKLVTCILWLTKKISKVIYSSKDQKKATGFDSVTEGSWYGNDTLWRVILDLNKIIIYADQHGKLHDHPQRKVLSIIDGGVGGEGEGPMHHAPIISSVIVGGSSFVLTDTVTAELMGFDFELIPQLFNAYVQTRHPIAPCTSPSEAMIIKDGKKISFDDLRGETITFKPPRGWQGHIERRKIASNSRNERNMKKCVRSIEDE